MKRWLLPVILSTLALISVLMLKSIAPNLVPAQTLFFTLGGIIFFLAAQIPIEQLQNLAWPFYLVVNLLLIIAYAYGYLTHQTGRWITLFGQYNLQPSQLAILATSFILISWRQSFNHLSSLIQALVIIALPAGLILIEPDLGTTLVYLVSVGSIIFVSDISWRKILSLACLGLISAVIAWMFLLQPYQKQRLTSFLDHKQDSQAANYNAQQALIAVGSGQIFGQGLGQGVQSHLRFLPEYQTDFIFAALAEEFGFVGALAVLILYFVLVIHIISLARQTSSKPASYFCTSVAVMTGIQAGVNMGMNVGLLPITGLTLPFISYGGSSILSLSLMYGLVQSINQRTVPSATLHLG